MTTAQVGALIGSLIIPLLILMVNIKKISKLKFNKFVVFDEKLIKLISNLVLLIILISILYIQVELKINSYFKMKQLKELFISVFCVVTGLYFFMRNNES